jgi:hypothetical protein
MTIDGAAAEVRRTPFSVSLRCLRGRAGISAVVPPLILLLGLLAYRDVYTKFRTDTPVHSDAEGYYAYIPAYILDHDPGFNTLIRNHVLTAYTNVPHFSPTWFGFSQQPSGRWLDKYGVGEALLVLPFFAVGHAIAVAEGANANGYSGPEVFAAGSAAVVYVALALCVLRSVLRRWFPDWAVAVTLVAITLGTSLFNYAAYDPLFNHAYSFFAVALLILTALRWYERPQSWPRVLAVGAVAGLIADIRLTNAVVLIAIPLLAVGSLAAFRGRLALFRRHYLRVLAGLGTAVAVFLPQSLTWYLSTGHWLVRAYPGESFDFVHPHLIESLLWLQPQGLLPYAPVLALAFAGLVLTWIRRRDIAAPVTAAFVLFWYVLSAWYDWSYSDGFGHRGFIDVLPLLAVPLAYFFASLRWRSLRLTGVTLAGAMTAGTVVLMIAYWQYRIGGVGITWNGYVGIFRNPALLFHANLGS